MFTEVDEWVFAKDIARGMSSSRYVVIQDRESAIRYAFKNSKPGDVVALIGKGHEKYEIGIGGRREFDEAHIVENTVLEELVLRDKTEE